MQPVFGLAGKWVPAEMRHSAEMTGATVIDRVSVLVTHLSSIIADNAARLLTREDVRVLTEGVKQVNAPAVDDLVPTMLSLAELPTPDHAADALAVAICHANAAPMRAAMAGAAA